MSNHLDIFWISIGKDRLFQTITMNKKILYQAARDMVLEEVFRRTLTRKIWIIIDKRYPKKSDCTRLERQNASTLAREYAGNFIPKIQINQYDSDVCRELQIHDFVVGTIFQHVERDVDAYIRLIESNIVSGQQR